MTAQGYARVTDLEPGMEFQSKPDGGGFHVFEHVEPAGLSRGRRWVRVTTRDGGHQLLYEWDAMVPVRVDRS